MSDMSDIWHDPLFLAALKKGGAGGTASGDIVTFNAPKASPLKALSLSIDPVQDLHGYDAPWPGGGGKNLLDAEYTESITLSKVIAFDPPLPAGTYTFSFVSADTASQVASYQVGVYKDTTAAYSYYSVSPSTKKQTFTIAETCSKIVLYSNKAYTESVGFTTVFTGLQVESGSTATTYSPYSNLCPISGWDGANLWRTGKNLDPYDNLNSTTKLWGSNSTNQIAVFRSLAVGTYTMSCKFKVLTNPDAESTVQYGVLVRYSNGQGGYVTIIPYQLISAPATVGAVYEWSKSFTLTESLAGESTLAVYFYCASGGTSTITANAYDIQIELGSTPTAYQAYQGTTIPITFTEAGTVYGGVWDVLSGVLRVTHVSVDMGALSWGKGTTQSAAYGEYAYFTAAPSPAKALNFNFISSCYKTTRTHRNALANGEMGVSNTNTSGYKSFAVRNDAYADSTGEQFATAMSGQTIVYELATPLTYTLTAAQLDTLVGQNVVWADCGDVTVEYLSAGGANPDLMKLAVAFMGR